MVDKCIFMHYNTFRVKANLTFEKETNMKKLLSLILTCSILLLGATMFASCGEDNTLIVYTEAGFAPWETTDGLEVVGVDIEIAKYIADKYGYDLEVVNGSFDTIVAGISEDNAIGLAGISWTAERAEAVDFSDFYYEGAIQCVVYKTASNPTLAEGDTFAVSNFAGKKVAVQTGTTGHMYADGNKGADAWNCTVNDFKQYAMAVEEVKSGDADYIVVDNAVAEQLCDSNEGFSYKVCEGATPEKYAAVCKKGNTELLEKVNAAIAELLQKDKDGKTQIDKWLEEYMG